MHLMCYLVFNLQVGLKGGYNKAKAAGTGCNYNFTLSVSKEMKKRQNTKPQNYCFSIACKKQTNGCGFKKFIIPPTSKIPYNSVLRIGCFAEGTPLSTGVWDVLLAKLGRGQISINNPAIVAER